MNCLMSKPAMLLWVTCCSVPMLITKKNTAMKIGGITDSNSRGTARSARPAIDTMSRATGAGRACTELALRATGTSRVVVIVIVLPPRLRFSDWM